MITLILQVSQQMNIDWNFSYLRITWKGFIQLSVEMARFAVSRREYMLLLVVIRHVIVN